jgi:alkylated DNA repair protein alkB family protein 6
MRVSSSAQTATRARMPPLDLKRLFDEERARRRAAAGASTSAESAPERLEALEARAAYSMTDHDVGRFAARPVSGLFYVPEFVTEAEERALLRSIRAPENDRRWTRGDGGRRVGNWGGKPSDADVTEPLPVWARAVVDALFARRVFSETRDETNEKSSDAPPNHVLVNEYRAPAGIFPHNDGGVYAPKVAILTLEGDALIDFWENDGSDAASDATVPRRITTRRRRRRIKQKTKSSAGASRAGGASPPFAAGVRGRGIRPAARHTERFRGRRHERVRQRGERECVGGRHRPARRNARVNRLRS